MSGLLSRCPPLRAQAHTVRKPGCLRACCVRCPACPRWSFALRSCRSPLQVRGFPRSHLVCPHVLVWARSLCSLGGVLAEACCGRVCSRVAGVGCLRYCPCSPFGVCVLWCVRSPGGGGTIIVPSLLPRLAWLVLTLWCGLEKRVRGCCVPDGRRVALLGRDMVVPPHTAWRCPPPDAWRGRREGLGVRALSWCANTRAHGERKRGGREGASRGGPWWPGRGRW